MPFTLVQEPNTLKIDDLRINKSLSEKLLDWIFDCKFNFNEHNENICQKASNKLNALTRLGCSHTWEQPENAFL